MSRSQLRLLLAAVFVACVAVRHRPVGSWALSVGCAPSRWRLRWRATTAARSERLSRPPPVLRAPPLQERVRWRSASGLIRGVLCADQDGFHGAGCWALSFCCAPRTAWPDGTSLSTVLDVKMVEIDTRCVACPPHTPPARPTHRSHKPPSMKLSPRSSLRRRLIGFSVPTRRKVLRGFAPLAPFLCRRLLVFECEAVVTHRHRMRV